MSRCEDFPCCGHTDLDPCGPSIINEPWFCDECGIYHMFACDSDYIRDIHDDYDEDDPYAGTGFDGYEDSWLDGSYEE